MFFPVTDDSLKMSFTAKVHPVQTVVAFARVRLQFTTLTQEEGKRVLGFIRENLNRKPRLRPLKKIKDNSFGNKLTALVDQKSV